MSEIKQKSCGCSRKMILINFGLFYVQLAFAIFYVIGKPYLSQVDALVFAALRGCIAIPILVVFALVTEGPKKFVPDKSLLPRIAVCGILTVSGSQGLFTLGLSLSTPVNSAIFQPSITIYTTVLSLIFGIEKWSWKKGAGILTSVCGALVMLHVWNFDTGNKYLVGNLLFVINTFSFSCGLIGQRPVFQKGISAPVYVVWSFLFGYIPLFTYAAVRWEHVLQMFQQMGPGFWGMSAYVGVIATATTFMISSMTVKHASPVMASVYIPASPLLTSILSFIVLGSKPGLVECIGALLILSGVFVVVMTKHREAEAEAKRMKQTTEMVELRNGDEVVLPSMDDLISAPPCEHEELQPEEEEGVASLLKKTQD